MGWKWEDGNCIWKSSVMKVVVYTAPSSDSEEETFKGSMIDFYLGRVGRGVRFKGKVELLCAGYAMGGLHFFLAGKCLSKRMIL